MRSRTAIYVYFAALAGAVLANFLLWRYRLHLYEINTDYEREPLQTIQLVLFRGTQAFIVAGLVWLAWWKLSKKNALENHRTRSENRTYQTNLDSLVRERSEQLQTARANLERSYDTTLDALSNAMSLKDHKTEGHARRVTLSSIAIAQALGLPRERIAVIARGAFLHDIGKMAIADNILNKPGGLEPHEMEIMREHPYHGYQIVKKIPFLSGEVAEIVYSHHEWFNGEGHPRVLRGEEIPLGARIVAIANALDSITSDLPYRRAQSFSAARAEIQLWSGRQFDPEIVKVFLEMPDKIWEDLRRDLE